MRSDAARQGDLRHGGRAVWLNLIWKLALVASILLLLSFENPLLSALSWSLVNPLPPVLLVWGALAVGFAANNLFDLGSPLQTVWVILAVGAYGALALPALIAGMTNSGILGGPDRFEDAAGPVIALTLAAHLGRRDLPRALRDWAVLVGLALFVSLGVLGMWAVATELGLWPFVLLVLLPPLLFEGLLLVLGRSDSMRGHPISYALAIAVATAISVAALSLLLLNPAIPLLGSVLFDLVAALLVGGALLLALFTRPMIDIASGARHGGYTFARAIVELSHAPILIALAIYLPLRFLSRA
jgi:hypothetical protein